MSKIAIISAAGWKGSGREDGLAGCPEPFLPLGDGTTTLSRTATALAENGFKLYIAVGRQGYPYSKYVRWAATPNVPVFDDKFPWEDSPWTQERYDYAAQFGTVIEMPNPGGWSTSFDTFCIAMDAIDKEDWDYLLLARGDMLIPRHCLDIVIECTRPFVFLFTAFHSYFGLDREGAKFLREYMEPFRRFATKESWKSDKNYAPDHWGTEVLKEAGFGIYNRGMLPTQMWTDIDISAIYHDTRRLIAEGAYRKV